MFHKTNFLILLSISCLITASVVIADETTPNAIDITGEAKYFTIGVPSYRGMVSARHRTKNLQFPIHFNQFPAGQKSARVIFSILNADGKSVSHLDTKFPLTGNSTDTWVSIPFSSNQAGTYQVEALLVIPRTGDSPTIRETRTASFNVIQQSRGQAIFDDDGTLLFNGTPYFPIGVSGIKSDVNANLGFSGYNAQFFNASSIGDDGYGAPLGLDRAVGYRRKCFFDMPVNDRAACQEIIDIFGFHPAIAMWHVAEAGKGATPGSEWLRATDPCHPLYAEVDTPDAFLAQKSRVDVPGFPCNATLSDALPLVTRLEKDILPHNPAFCILRIGSDNVDETRAAAYAALVHNVRGIILSGNGKIDMTTWKKSGFPELASELVSMRGALSSTNRRTFTDGDLHGIVCGNGVNGRYLILVNTSNKKVHANFELPELQKVDKVSVPFYKPGDDKDSEEPLVISDADIEAPLISKDDMGMEIPTLDRDLLVVSDKKLNALAAAKRNAKGENKDDPDARARLNAAMQAVADSKAAGGDEEEEDQVKTIQLFCGRVQNTFKPHGTLVYRW